MDFMQENMSISYAFKGKWIKIFAYPHNFTQNIPRYSGDIQMYLLEAEKSENFGHYQREMYS